VCIVKPQVKGLVCAGFGVLGLVHGFAHLKNWRVLGKVRTDPKPGGGGAARLVIPT
jgi:hypothetical protein